MYPSVLITVINSLSVKTTARVVTILSTSKVIAVIFVAMVGVVFTFHRGVFPEVFTHPFQTIEGHVTSPATVALAMYGVLWSYDGWWAHTGIVVIVPPFNYWLIITTIIGNMRD